jgi:hypothetical protein
MRRRALLIHEQTVEREGEEVWALWEEVGSRGLDTWTGLPALYAIPDCSGSQPGASIHSPCSGKGGRKVRAAVPLLPRSPRSRRRRGALRRC